MKTDAATLDLRFTPISIIVRHSADCARRDDPQYKRCTCWKHLRFSVQNQMYWVPTKQRTWEGAERFKREYLDNHDPTRAKIVSTRTTIREAIDAFVKEKEGQNLSHYVPGKYRLELDRMHAYLESAGVFLLEDVKLTHLTAFRSTWASNWWPEALSRRLVQGRLRGFFRWTVLAYDLPRNPSLGLGPIKVEHRDTLPLTEAEFKALLAAIPVAFPETSIFRLRMRALVLLMRWSGLAINDAACLQRSQIQQSKKHGQWVIRTSRAKTGVGVCVPVPMEVIEALQAIVNGNPAYVFWSGTSKRENASAEFTLSFRKLFDAAQIVDGHSHRLRDTAAIEWLKSGLSLFEVSKLLGHKSMKTTADHYAAWVQDLQDRIELQVIASWKS